MEKKGYGTGKRTKRDIGASLMVINIKQEIIDILQIANRRFMYKGLCQNRNFTSLNFQSVSWLIDLIRNSPLFGLI